MRFVNGRRYRYYSVPADVAAEMQLAFAKGTFFNEKIRGRFVATLIESPGEGSAGGDSGGC